MTDLNIIIKMLDERIAELVMRVESEIDSHTQSVLMAEAHGIAWVIERLMEMEREK